MYQVNRRAFVTRGLTALAPAAGEGVEAFLAGPRDRLSEIGRSA